MCCSPRAAHVVPDVAPSRSPCVSAAAPTVGWKSVSPPRDGFTAARSSESELGAGRAGAARFKYAAVIPAAHSLRRIYHRFIITEKIGMFPAARTARGA
jgi:hypothetical protein